VPPYLSRARLSTSTYRSQRAKRVDMESRSIMIETKHSKQANEVRLQRTDRQLLEGRDKDRVLVVVSVVSVV
jgi:hypothetical protein